jgi:NAD(P)-dependent dehydrogenase (short-subunit alcohol dehydrogenase family)
MDLGLKGKNVIITGGASNIGRAITLAFAGEGANIVIADLDEKQAAKVVEKAKQTGAGKVIVVKTDVTDFGAVENMVTKVSVEMGSVDILVNNVGWDIQQLFIETGPDFWDKVININYRSVLNCTKAVLAPMREQGKGVIVSIGSDAGRVGEFKEAVYGGTKGAVIAFTKAVAREMGKYNIRLNVVCPGLTLPGSAEEYGEDSPWKMTTAFFTDEIKEKIRKNYPLRRLGTSQDIANAVLFMASEASNFITGQTLSVSGGYSMM